VAASQLAALTMQQPLAGEPGIARPTRWRLAPVLACAAVLFFFALQLVLQGPMTRIDQDLTLYLATHRQAWLSHAMLLVSNSHGTEKLLGVTVLLGLWRFGRRDLGAVRLLAVVPAGMLLNVGLKNLFQRPRPTLEEPLVQLSTYSFPSGHAVASTVFYGALCALVFMHTRSTGLRVLAVALGIAMVLLVTFSRVYLGAHYLSDVVAGVSVGLLCLLLFLRFVRR
jgi:membrane-associated phospholipid phosphatase